MTDLTVVSKKVENVLLHLFSAREPIHGELLVVGCSTSAVEGKPLGSSSSEAVADSIMRALTNCCARFGVVLAVQGCEHINRSLVIPKSFAFCKGMVPINIIPELKAGGALSSAYFSSLGEEAMVVENLGIGADFGIDIGGVLIGMHLRRDRVAVPVSIEEKIGVARVNAAYCRYKWVGGPRTHFID